MASLGAVCLCFGLQSVCSERKIHDMLLLSNSSNLHRPPCGVTSPLVHPVTGFDSVSRCPTNQNSVWTASHPTPHLPNLCPSPAHSVHVDLCLPAKSHIKCTPEGFAEMLERSCHCGISGAHLGGVNLTCTPDSLYAEGPVFALSNQQRERMAQTLHTTHLHSCSAVQEPVHSKEPSLGLQVGLVVTVVMLCVVGGAIFYYLYKKKRPQNYFSMEMNEQDAPVDL